MNTTKSVPYHLFEVNGEFFVFDTTGCRFYQINEWTSRCLQSCLQNEKTDAKGKMLSEFPERKQEIEQIFFEISALGECGLFDLPESVRYSAKELEDEFSKTDFLYSVELMLAETCNLACKYCYCEGMRDRPHILMSRETAQKAVDFLFEYSGSRKIVDIVLWGGEPLLNKPVFNFVLDYSQRLGQKYGKQVQYRMTTNAVLIDDEIVAKIKEYNIGIMVSIDGPKEMHDAQCPTRSGDGSFDLVMAGIEKLISAGIQIEGRCTLTSPVPDIRSIFSFMGELPLRNVVIGPTVNVRESNNSANFTEDDFSEYCRQNEELLPWLQERIQSKEGSYFLPQSKFINQILSGKTSEKPIPWKCGMCTLGTAIGADGALFPCSKFAGMSAWKIGDLTAGRNEERCREILFDYVDCISEFCYQCWAYPICQGPCPWELALSSGKFSGPPRFCEQTKRMFFELAGFICTKEPYASKFAEEIAKAEASMQFEKLSELVPDE